MVQIGVVPVVLEKLLMQETWWMVKDANPKAKVNWGSQVASEREQELFFLCINTLFVYSFSSFNTDCL